MKKIKATVQHIVEKLVQKDYAGLEKLTRGTRLNQTEIAQCIEDYGQQLIAPPDSAFDNLDIVPVRDSFPKKYSVRFTLFTKEEGLSDLSIEITLIDERSQDFMIVTIDNILVL